MIDSYSPIGTSGPPEFDLSRTIHPLGIQLLHLHHPIQPRNFSTFGWLYPSLFQDLLWFD